MAHGMANDEGRPTLIPGSSRSGPLLHVPTVVRGADLELQYQFIGNELSGPGRILDSDGKSRF